MTTKQYATFWLEDRMFGIDVEKVQEILNPLSLTPIPLSPEYVLGLMNLRGQLATCLGLREMFHIPGVEENRMFVVCHAEDGGHLISLVVDRVGDVLELTDESFEETPDNVNPEIASFMSGIHKLPDTILSIINLDKIEDFLQKEGESHGREGIKNGEQ